MLPEPTQPERAMSKPTLAQAFKADRNDGWAAATATMLVIVGGLLSALALGAVAVNAVA